MADDRISTGEHMKCSEDQKALVAALLAARQAFPVITKTKSGQSGNRTFKYAPLDEVLDAVMPALCVNGLLLTQGTDGHELVTRLDHISGQWREHRMPVNAEHASMQSYGIELTYRRRYAIQPMLGITTEEDTDGKGAQKRKSGVDHEANEAKPLRIKATDGAGASLSAERKAILKECALYLVDCHKNGDDASAIRVWYADDTCADNDERIYLWSLLSAESKLRATIKASKPAKEATQ